MKEIMKIPQTFDNRVFTSNRNPTIRVRCYYTVKEYGGLVTYFEVLDGKRIFNCGVMEKYLHKPLDKFLAEFTEEKLIMINNTKQQDNILPFTPVTIGGTEYKSVLQDWVMKLGLREQGTLMTAVRGCDLTPKLPLDSQERTLTAFIRYSIMNAFDYREIDSEAGCFMQTRIPEDFRASNFGHYPLHYVMHLIHAMEIIGYRCPDGDRSRQAMHVYGKFVRSFHLFPESLSVMQERLSEDRIANNNIVE